MNFKQLNWHLDYACYSDKVLHTFVKKILQHVNIYPMSNFTYSRIPLATVALRHCVIVFQRIELREVILCVNNSI